MKIGIFVRILMACEMMKFNIMYKLFVAKLTFSTIVENIYTNLIVTPNNYSLKLLTEQPNKLIPKKQSFSTGSTSCNILYFCSTLGYISLLPARNKRS